MTPIQLTRSEISKLVQFVAASMEKIDELASSIDDAAGKNDDANIDVGAKAFLAVELHRYYTGLESVLERIVRVIDGTIPAGESWHRDLLMVASRPISNLRPTVLDAKAAGALHRLLAFRHFFRHAYFVELDWNELEPHRHRVVSIHPQIKAQIDRFVAHLRDTLDELRSGSDKD